MIFPVTYPAVLARRRYVGADCHGNDLYETSKEKICLMGVTQTSSEREDTDGNTYTSTVKLYLPACVKDIKPYDVITVDGETVFTIREYPKQYRSPWPSLPLGEAPGQVVYGVRKTT